MQPWVSIKLRIISFLAMLGVLWWHCFCGSGIEVYFMPVACYWAVPFFFFSSGVFLQASARKYSWGGGGYSQEEILFSCVAISHLELDWDAFICW